MFLSDVPAACGPLAHLAPARLAQSLEAIGRCQVFIPLCTQGLGAMGRGEGEGDHPPVCITWARCRAGWEGGEHVIGWPTCTLEAVAVTW